MIEKEFNDRIYTKSTAKREKYTIFMLQNVSTQFRASPFERALFSALNRVLLIN